MISVSLGIPHTPWKADRANSFARLMESLLRDVPPPFVEVRAFTDRAPNWEWSGKMWRWAAETMSTHFLQLQDDVISAPKFWPSLLAMLEALPGQIIGLESVHHRSPDLHAQGHRWYTTSDGLIGVGYVLPMPQLRDFLVWRATKLCKGAIESITEDTLLCVWALSTGRRIWHPMPTIIDHDVSIPSTYGNDTHAHRRPLVCFADHKPATDPSGWRDIDPPHLGSFYDGRVAKLARRWVIGATDEDWETWRDA
jgi:hypothetical protein